MAKKPGKKSGDPKRKRESSVKDLPLRARRGGTAGAVKGGERKSLVCLAE